MSLPLSFVFQGLPGPVGDPGPKGSRVSGPQPVPHRWHPGWASPVPTGDVIRAQSFQQVFLLWLTREPGQEEAS